MDSLKIVSKTRPASAPKSEAPIVLKAEGLVKIYGKRRVVDGVSFEVRAGEVVGLLGANGAGKTTSFRMSCGLIPANEGRVTLNGIDVTSWPMYRRAREGGLGYLPQDRSTFGALTTEQNLLAAMEFLGYSRSEQKEALEESLTKFNLRHIRKTRVGAGGTGGLSGGERRRLEIARALLARPKILLLDEPFANVDPITVEGMQAVIESLAAEGISVLITDHQVEETLMIIDRCYVVNSGKVLCSGTPEDALQNRAAVEKYFGERAPFILAKYRERKRKREARANRSFDDASEIFARPKSDAPAVPAAEIVSEFAVEPPPSPKRSALGLGRRKDEPIRRTPSPADEPREENRFDDKMKKMFERD